MHITDYWKNELKTSCKQHNDTVNHHIEISITLHLFASQQVSHVEHHYRFAVRTVTLLGVDDTIGRPYCIEVSFFHHSACLPAEVCDHHG